MFVNGQQISHDKVAIYIRWSTEEQGQGTTLEVQQEACEHYCRSQGWTFREDLIFVDEGYSAGDLNRPALTHLREAIQAGLVACVVVYKLDRLSRNLADCVSLVRQEWGGKCALYSTRENFDTNSPVGQMVFNILMSFAEFERNVIRDRTLSGKRKRAEQGRNAGQRYPYGYRKGAGGEWALDGRDEERQSLTGPAAVVQRIFKEYLSGVGTVTIAHRLNQDGIPAPMGREWRFGAIIRTLDNPIYAGRYEYGKTKGNVGGGLSTYLVVGAVPAIVTEEEFQTVQRLRRERAGTPPRSLNSTFLLSGIARCQKCGGSLNGFTGKQKRYYVCNNRAVNKSCDCAWIDADKLESALLAEARAAIAEPDIRQQIEWLNAEIHERTKERIRAVTRAEAEVVAINRKRKRLDEAFFSGSLDAGVYNSRALQLDADLSRAQEATRRAETALQETNRTTTPVGQLVRLARHVDAWAELSPEEHKQALRGLTASLAAYQAQSRQKGKQGNRNPLQIEWRPRLDISALERP